MTMNRKFYIITALLALSVTAWGQSDRVKTVEVPDSASGIFFDTTGLSVQSTNVQAVIQEILASSNFGNVLFVTAGGIDSIAVEGEIFKAWDDPWEAVENASSGDLVYVYPGTYTTLEPNSNLWKDGVTMYFSPNAVITQRPISAGGITFTLFYCNTPGEMNIFGGKFSTVGDGYSDNMIFVDTSDVSINVYGAQTVTQAMLAYGAINSSVNLNSIENLGRLVFTSSGIKADSVTDVTARISGNMYGIFHDAIAFISNNSKITRIEANILIGNLNVENIAVQGDRGLVQFTSSGSPMNNISIYANIDKGRIDNRSTDARIMLYGSNNLAAHTNVRYNMNCNQCRFLGNNKLSITGSNVKRLRGVSGVISGNYYFNGGAVMIGAGGSSFDANTNIIFDGVFIGETGELVDSIATGVPFTFEGIYKVNVAKPVFAWTSLTANTYSKFKNATLINAGGDKVVVPAGAYLNGFEKVISANESILFKEMTVTESYDFELGDSTRITYLSDGILKSSYTGAIYSEIPGVATFYEESIRQYELMTAGADTIITVDTLSVSLSSDSISVSNGLIENLKADTVRWLVSYDFVYDSDEDACTAIMDLTTDGTETPAAIPGSASLGDAISPNVTQMPGRTFLVDVPTGEKIRLCVKGNVGVAIRMNISYLTITVQEVYRE